MGGMFTAMQGAANKVAKVVKTVDPIGYKVNAKLDAGGNAIGAYGSDAPKPLYDPGGTAVGMYGSDSADADAATMNNARITALQQGDTDLADVNRRTSAMLLEQNPTRKTLLDRLG